MYSDHGKSFAGPQIPLRKWINSCDKQTIHKNMARKDTQFHFSWDFNTPKASHINGSIELLISSCRKAFNATLNYLKCCCTFSEWKMIVTKVNYLVNLRPLFPKNVEDLDEEPITENSLLFPCK